MKLSQNQTRSALKYCVKNMSFYLLIFGFFLFFNSLKYALADEECQSWFKNSDLKRGKDCLIECALVETDMGTFHCSEQCESLCKEQPKKSLYLTFFQAYPGLTQAERVLVAKYPKKMADAYLLAWTSENLCLNIFKESDINDESDACRHFVWAALLYKEFGLELSQKILNAHEDNKRQPLREKGMDLANNRLGLAVAIHLFQKNKLEKQEILKAFQKSLKEGKLVILKSRIRQKASKSVLKKTGNKLKIQKEHEKLKKGAR